MVCDHIGEDKFRKGLNIYLNRHKYSNAVTEDLWAALSEASGQDIKSFMDAYTKTMGISYYNASHHVPFVYSCSLGVNTV
jgi:aminopeptidase N